MNGLEIRKLSGRILIVDDELANVKLLERMLGYAGITDYFSTSDPRKAMDLCMATRPDAVLLDLNMPYLDGMTLLGQLADRFPCRLTLPILVLTADATTETKHRALQAGATDFLTKPLDALELILRLGHHLDTRKLHLEVLKSNELLESRVQERTADLEEAQAEIIDRLSVATESRDDDTGNHVERVANMTAQIAERLGFGGEDVEIFRRAARLHDIGKISVPDSILLKAGPLVGEEWEVMHQHTTAGAKILKGSRFKLMMCAEQIAHYHHERWDGGGYPEGLKGEAIPLPARMTAVADVFDALTSDRPYKKAWCVDAAVAEIHRQSGSHFDPRVVQAFLKLMEERTGFVKEPAILQRAA